MLLSTVAIFPMKIVNGYYGLEKCEHELLKKIKVRTLKKKSCSCRISGSGDLLVVPYKTF